MEESTLGPCAKRRVICTIVAPGGQRFVGSNDCRNPQQVCPRIPGEGYDKCKSVCQQVGHAEVVALALAGPRARGAHAVINGHYYACETCSRLMRDAGVESVTVVNV